MTYEHGDPKLQALVASGVPLDLTYEVRGWRESTCKVAALIGDLVVVVVEAHVAPVKASSETPRSFEPSAGRVKGALVPVTASGGAGLRAAERAAKAAAVALAMPMARERAEGEIRLARLQVASTVRAALKAELAQLRARLDGAERELWALDCGLSAEARD